MKRRVVFILGAKWKALVRGWRRDCVVGGMETRFQRRIAHSRTAKCEAFHVAPRLFFMFLFLVPPTIRQQFNHCPSNFPLSLDIPGMSLRFVGNYAPFWCRNHCSLLLPLCVRNLLRWNHKRPSPRLDTGVGHCHQAALIRSCGASSLAWCFA